MIYSFKGLAPGAAVSVFSKVFIELKKIYIHFAKKGGASARETAIQRVYDLFF